MPICATCADAADRRAPRDQHCDDPECCCQHRVERYGEHQPKEQS